MKRSLVVLSAVVALVASTAVIAAADSDRGVAKQDVIQIFESDGSASDTPYEAFGSAKLIRRDDGLKATAQISGLAPGGVYTFWWVVGDVGYALPDAFVALGDSTVVGRNGKATARMSARYGQKGIEGFLEHLTGSADNPTDPFHPTLDVDLATAEVHVEIAYHGQASDAGGDLGTWLSDFWTGTACPAVGDQAVTQPHCPVSYVAIFTP